MQSLLRSVVAVVVLTALVTGQAQAQIKREKKPPGGLGDLTTPVKSGTAAKSVPRPKGDRLDAIDPASGVVNLTNEFRAQEGKPKLKPSATLDRVAQRYALLMASKEQVGHQVDGKNGGQRLKEAGYVKTLSFNWSEHVGVQSGQKDPAAAQFQEWKDSKDKREFMLSTTFTEIGVGVATSSTGKVYFCQLLAKPK